MTKTSSSMENMESSKDQKHRDQQW